MKIPGRTSRSSSVLVAEEPGIAAQVWDWIDHRTGAKKMLHHTLQEPIPGGARFAYVFGSALLFILVLQVVTGLCLALYYVPSPVTAHVSVSYIVKEVAAGSFLRSLHSYGSSAMVVVLLLHFLQTLLFGSYKGKRELLWVAGCVLSLLMLGMAFTGYLLPWDQKAYFASSVGTNVAGQAPIVGEWIRRLLRGGSAMGTLTVSRFYVLHVFVIPAMIVIFVVAHVFLFRKAGAAGPIKEHPVEPKLRVEMFYPKQVLLDMAFALLVMGVLGTLAHFVPVKLGPLANPNDSHYLPRPEWYYLPLFQWLKYWEGPRAVIGMVVIPTILVGLLFLLPFLDRGIERRPWRRPIPVGAVGIVVFGLIWLGIKSHLDDMHDPATASQLARQDQEQDDYFHKPFEPYRMASLTGPLTVAHALSPEAVKGKALFEAGGCNACHGDAGVGGPIGPALTQISSKYPSAQIALLLKNPTPKMRAGGMPAQTLNEADMTALIAYLGSLGGAVNNSVAAAPVPSSPTPTVAAAPQVAPALLRSSVSTAPVSGSGAIAAGQQIVESRACFACHGEDLKGTPRAPSLYPVGRKYSDAALKHLLRNPTAKMTAGGMVAPDLNDVELSSVTAYLRSLSAKKDTAVASAATPPEKVAAPVTNKPASNEVTPEPAKAVVEESAPARSASVPATANPTPAAELVRISDPVQQKGEAIFLSHGCTACHGVGAAGTRFAPALTSVGKTMQAPQILNLFQHPTAKMKAGGMPPVKLAGDDMNALVEYILSLSAPPPAAPAVARSEPAETMATARKEVASLTGPVQLVRPEASEPRPAMSAVALQGRSIFAVRKCGSCHGAEGVGGSAAAPALANAGASLPAEMLTNMLRHPTGRMRQGGMPVFSLNDQEVQALAAYVSYISEPVVAAPRHSESGNRLRAARSANQALAGR